MMSTVRQGPATFLVVLSFFPVGVGAQEQNELDRFMARVLEQQGRNAASHLEYVLDEQAEVRFTGPDRDFRFRGDFTWYARDGVFVRSPLRLDGVPIGAEERRAYEARWLERERERRTRRAQDGAGDAGQSDAGQSDAGQSVAADDALMMHLMLGGFAADAARVASDPGDDEEVVDPGFVTDAYAFVDVLFESGNYYLAGREVWDGHEVLRIEYYPERLAPYSGDDDESVRDAEVDSELSKVLLVTLWVDPVQQQIVRYSFDNLGFVFLPGRWLFRLEDVTASMSMRQPFSGVWLPAQIEIRAVLRLSMGRYELRLARTFANYREAVTGGRLRAASEVR